MKESLSDKKVHVRTFTFGDKSKKYPYPMLREIDVKEKIQNAQKRLKEKLLKFRENPDSRFIIIHEDYLNGNIEKIFKEEFGDKLVAEQNKGEQK